MRCWPMASRWLVDSVFVLVAWFPALPVRGSAFCFRLGISCEGSLKRSFLCGLASGRFLKYNSFGMRSNCAFLAAQHGLAEVEGSAGRCVVQYKP
jgi:hypothetical protein